MRIVGWYRENGLAYQSLVNEISVEEMRTPRNKSKLMPGTRDVPSYATVSWNCRAIGLQIAKNKKFRDRIEEIAATIIQPQT
jgi:hypothetical protein